MTAHRLRCRLRGYSAQPTTATVEVLQLDRVDRTRRALRQLGLCWGGAILSVFIPVAHFFLVPGLFLIGIAFAVGALRSPELVRAARGTCPDCGAEQALDIVGRWKGGAEIACRQCHRMLRLEPTEPAEA